MSQVIPDPENPSQQGDWMASWPSAPANRSLRQRVHTYADGHSTRIMLDQRKTPAATRRRQPPPRHNHRHVPGTRSRGGRSCLQYVSSERVGSVDTSPVFPGIRSCGIRDPRNTARDLRRSLEVIGFGWVSAHVIGRKSLATWMDQGGRSARAAADQLGHRRISVTTDTYFGRKIAHTGAAELLEIIGE
jgi:integrase